MSENLDLVRSIYAAWERGDYSSADWADADIEFVSVDGPEPGSWRGRTAMAAMWAGFLAAWHDHRVEVEEYRRVDDERVLVLNRVRAEGKTSGFEIGETNTDHANLFGLRDGKVVRLDLHWHRDRALADLGLEE
jgi:ketosteroid isomerase-like protein